MAEEKKVEKKDRFKLAKEFKAFISRGNVLDMAVGLIIGSAFTAIVNSLVGDLLMPLLGLLTGKMDFSQLKLVLRPAVEEVLDETGAVVTPAVAEYLAELRLVHSVGYKFPSYRAGCFHSCEGYLKAPPQEGRRAQARA